jgi:hypothetical protein
VRWGRRMFDQLYGTIKQRDRRRQRVRVVEQLELRLAKPYEIPAGVAHEDLGGMFVGDLASGDDRRQELRVPQ